jgi:uncharacterized protein YgbK (DUF1537 family)
MGFHETQNWTVLADDLTGACDTGVAFARRGFATRVVFTPEADFTGAAVRVVTTESRALAGEEAARAVERAVRGLHLTSESRVYKKIDSTLRGQPGAELVAVMRAAGIERALVGPAFPDQGRVVRGGRVFIHDVPLEQTSFGREVDQPDLPRLFGVTGAVDLLRLEDVRLGVPQLVEIIGHSSAPVLVADAETDADLMVLVRACASTGIRLLCGSAGLARALVGTMPPGEEQIALERQTGPVLVAAGSYNPVTLRQVEMAQREGVQVVNLTPNDLRIANLGNFPLRTISGEAHANSGGGIAVKIKACLLHSENVILYARIPDRLPGKEEEIGIELAALTAAVLTGAQVGGLVLTGGETAALVCRALGCSGIDLGGEIQPGVVWGRMAGGAFAGLPVVTKAGGFGDENTLVEVIRFLNGKG